MEWRGGPLDHLRTQETHAAPPHSVTCSTGREDGSDAAAIGQSHGQ